MRQEHPRFVEAGARCAAVFMGPPGGVGTYCREREVPFACLADPDRTGYRAFGLDAAGLRRWGSPRVVWGGIKLFRRGIATGLPHNGQDIRQMPGTFVVSRGGRILLAHYHADASDNPDIDALLGALGAS